MADKKSENNLGPLYPPTEEELRKVGIHAARASLNRDDLVELLSMLGIIETKIKEKEKETLPRYRDYGNPETRSKRNQRRRLQRQYWAGRRDNFTQAELDFAFPMGIPMKKPKGC